MIFVVGGLVLLVGLIVVLVVLGMRAGREHDDDDWMNDDPQPRGRRSGDQDEGAAADRRVAGGPLSAPTDAAPAEPRRGKKKSEQMGDDDYWATITFDKPKFPWQQEGAKAAEQPSVADPLEAAEPEPVQAAAGPDGYADGYNDQYAHDQYGNEQYADGQYADGQYGNEQYADGQYANDQYGDDYYAGQGAPQAPGGYEPEPVVRGWQVDEPMTRFDQPAVRDFDPPYDSQPSYDQPAVYDQPAAYDPQPSYDQPAVYDQPAAYDPPRPPVPPQADPLGLPDPFARPAAARAESRDPEATQAYSIGGPSLGGPLGGAPFNQNPLGTGPQSAGPLGTGPQNAGPLAGGPLGTGPQNANPLNTGPLGGGPLGSSSSPLTSGPLGTGPSPLTPPLGGAPSSYGGQQEPQPATDTDGNRLPTVDELLQRIQADRRKPDSSASYGGSAPLNDPLNDPLNPSDGEYGSSWQSSSPPRYDDSLGGSPYGAEQGYPTAPAYGGEAAPRYDDPLGGYGSQPTSSSYGAYQQGQDSGDAGRYSDFSGPSFPGSAGDQNTPYSAPPAEQPPYGGQYGDQPAPRSTEEWDSYRDYRH
ncbi:hypothetical protein ABGB12_14465 [Actinocorallia sp. B10E7]|uniref:hypothetical protein n=1 Tax=Actinocorallia sp. B10E7 TaxID=3153558 RepID=UPI00325F6E04